MAPAVADRMPRSFGTAGRSRHMAMAIMAVNTGWDGCSTRPREVRGRAQTARRAAAGQAHLPDGRVHAIAGFGAENE